jgi:CRP-like cAMP-binding protein
VVQSPARAAYTSADRFAAAAARSPAIREMIVHYGDVLLAQVQQTVLCNTLHHLQARLSRWLLHAHDRAEGDTLSVTQQLLSDILGAQRTSITMISRMLQSEGIIDVRRGHVRIRDAVALEAKACPCYRIVRRLTQDPAPRPATLSPFSEFRTEPEPRASLPD